MKKKPDPQFPAPDHVKVYQYDQETIIVPKGSGSEILGGEKKPDQHLPKSLLGKQQGSN